MMLQEKKSEDVFDTTIQLEYLDLISFQTIRMATEIFYFILLPLGFPYLWAFHPVNPCWGWTEGFFYL